jgi:uncharacterized membrane protein YeaQ/YmgE (transglycosylase-associated protein family)
MLSFIIGLVVVGLIAGFAARALVPGSDPMGTGGTIVLGIVGSFVGGFLADVFFRNGANDRGLNAAGIIGSIVGSIVALLVWRAANGRQHVTHR